MPSPSRTAATFIVFLASALAVAGQSIAQIPAPPTARSAPAAVPATPAQTQAIAAFRPHAEQLCQALYLRPDAAASCVERILDTALPLDMDSTKPRTPSVTPPAESRATTVAPDGRE
jgi:hypothetical protein